MTAGPGHRCLDFKAVCYVGYTQKKQCGPCCDQQEETKLYNNVARTGVLQKRRMQQKHVG